MILEKINIYIINQKGESIFRMQELWNNHIRGKRQHCNQVYILRELGKIE